MTEREVETVERKDEIVSGKTFLGIEFGSTRIKAVLTDADHTPIASGSHEWENRLDHGIWTYTMDDIWGGLQDCYRDLKKDVKEQYGVTLTKIRAIGFSAMMHGYLAFDKAGELLVPFRTWRNTITEEAAAALTKEFSYNIPQRWSIAHLYQAMLNKEEHVKDIAFFTTLAGFIHWKLTGEKVLGVGDASGMFPIDSNTKDYDAAMLDKFDALAEPYGFDWSLRDILPKVLVAGENAGTLTTEGARLLDTDSGMSTGGRCGNRYGSDQQCGCPHRKRIRRYFCICYDCTGKGIKECAHRDRSGDYTIRRSSCHGALQQLYIRPECMGQSV